MADLSDRVYVVTGATSGIGRATVELLVDRGATVIGVARGDDGLALLADDLAGGLGRFDAESADVTDAAALERVVSETVGRFGRLDGWVSAAAVATYGALEDIPVEEFERVLDVNVMGVVHGARAALPQFRRQGYGVLVNVSSVLGRFGAPYISSYVASKFAVRGLGESLRMELRDLPRVAVSTVLPSSVDTPFFQHSGVHAEHHPKAPSGAIDARRVARAIVATLQRPRREVVVGLLPRAILVGHTLAPGLVEGLLGPVFARDLFTDVPASDSSGALFEPADDVRVSGGWPAVGRFVGRSLAAVAGAAVTAAGVAAGVRDQRRAR